MLFVPQMRAVDLAETPFMYFSTMAFVVAEQFKTPIVLLSRCFLRDLHWLLLNPNVSFALAAVACF
jgi:hypothetical protein